MDTIADYTAWKAKQQQTGVNAANVVLSTTEGKPDEVAGDLNLANEFGKVTGGSVPPTPLVKEYRNVFQQRIEEERNKTILSSAPRLTEWLRNTDNAAVAKDDLQNLSWWETVLGATSNALSRGVRRLPMSYNQYMVEQSAQVEADKGRTVGEIYRDTTSIRDAKGNVLSQSIIPGPGQLFSFIDRLTTARSPLFANQNMNDVAAGYQQQVGQIQKRIAEIPMSPAGSRFRDAFMKAPPKETAMAQVGDFMEKIAADPAGAAAFLTETAVESVPSIAAATGVTLATRSPALGAVAMGAQSYAQERFTSPAEFLTEKGIDLSTPEGARRVISDPALMQEAAQRGVIRGLIIGTLDGLSGGVAGKELAKSPLGNAVVQAVTQAVMGGAGEAGAQLATDGKVDMRDVIVEALAEFVTSPAEVAGIGGRRMLDMTRKAKDAAGRVALFQELSGQSQASALRNRLPDKFREIVEAATANGPVENVYVPADQFSTYFQSIGVDPFEIVDTLEGVTRDDLEVAIAGGGDLQIPTATYAAKIAGSEHDAFLMENMRFDPDQFTAREAAEFNARAQEVMQEAWDMTEAARVEQELNGSYEQEIYDTMVSRLRTAGRATDVATNEAMLYPAFYRTMAERSGMTIDDLLRRYPLPEVKGSLPEGMQFRNVDELNRTLAEARNRRATGLEKRGPTLLEFISDYGGINDVGGELKARDAEVIRRGKGKKTLRLARRGFVAGMTDMIGTAGGKKFGVDDVALAAIEAGYLADNPVANEYRAAMIEGRQVPDLGRALLEAIDAELRGQAQYAGDVATAQDENAALDSIEEYLSSLGVSLENTDEEIRTAIEGARQYAQVTPDQARAIDMAVELPSDPLFAEAVANTPGASIVDDGLLIDLVRYQKEEQAGSTSVRTGVFYLPTGSAQAKYYKGGKNDYGGKVEVRGETLIKRPLFVKGATGGKAPEAAFDQIKGKGAYDKMRTDVLNAIRNKRMVDERGYNLLEEYGADGNMIWEIVPNSTQGNTLAYALQENIVAHAVREAGYDAVVGYSIGRGGKGAFLSEVFDVREIDYPTPGETATLHPKFEAGRTYYQYGSTQSDIDAFAKGLEEELSLRSLSLFLTRNGDLKLNMIAVPKDKLGGGIGSKAMQRIIAFADERGLRVTLTTGQKDDGFGTTSTSRLIKFYKRFGFIENKGRNKDFAISDNMYREPERRLFQRNEIGARGSIQFMPDGQSIIRLFETANLSTMLHESGHYFLTIMQDMASKGEQSAITEFEAVKGWWRENAAAVAADARRAMPDVKVTKEDVLRALDTGSTGDTMLDGAIDVGMQEQWARVFEAYLMEGKAPSVELRTAFEKFRAWLVSIYKRLAGLNVTISDDIRGVFDRLLATDEEIAKAKAETGDTGPTFASGEQMGLTPEEYAALMKLRSQAEDDAKARLLRETMAPVKREQEKAYKAEKAKVREEVEREVNAFGYYRAIEWMGNRRWLGEGQPIDMPDMRLSKTVLVERYGAGILETLPRGKQTVYTVDGGVDPDDAAGWFGFGSGDEMIRAMERAPKRNEAIDAETERVMRDRHGDPLNDGSIEAAALDAVHTDKRGQWIAAELKAITETARVTGIMTAKEARATARDTISRMRVRDAMNANRFLSAERKAAEEAARLGVQLARDKIWLDAAKRRIATTARAAIRGEASPDAAARAIDDFNAKFETTSSMFSVADQQRVSPAGNEYTIPGGERTTTSLGYNDLVAKLVEAKRRQLLNHALYMEARKVAEEVEKAERYVARLGKASTRERIAGAGRRDNAQVDYLAAIDELLAQYDFRRLSGAGEARRGALNAFIERMRAAGRENELAIPEKVLADASRKPYKTLPVDELRGVIDSLKNLEHIALRWDKLIDAQREIEFSATAEAVAAAIDANLSKRPPGPVRTKGEQVRNTFRAYLDSVLNATTLLREIDGFTDQGAAYQAIKAPIDEAQNRLIVRKQAAAAKLEELYSVYTKEERRNMAVREHMPALGMSLSKWERIAIALNTGNEGNLSRLTDTRQRRPLTIDQVRTVLATLDARDADFIQSVWDYIGSFKGDIAARERRATGVEPQWVEPSPVSIGGKELRGGYYPIKYDTRLSSNAADRETVDIAQSLTAGRFGKAQTRNGHLKERAAAGDGSLDFDMSVMHRHVNQVIYDLEMSEPVANAWRLIQDGRVRSALDDAGRSSDFDALQSWLKDAAEGELGATSPVGSVLRGVKSNFTAAKLAFNLSNALIQMAGVAQSFVVVGKKDMAIGIMKTARDPFGMAKEVAAKSPFMSNRQTTFNKDIMDFYADPREGMHASRWNDFKRNIWGPLSFWLMQKVQWHFADVPTWVAGYDQGMRKFGGDEARAIAHADGLVKRAQASGLFIDRAGIERGSLSSRNRQNDMVKLFSTLGSYMFAKFNVAYERSATASRSVRQEGVSFKSAQEVASWTLDMVLLFSLEAVIMAAIKGKLPGDDDDEEDDGWIKWLAKETAFSVLGTLPFIRDGASALKGYSGGGAYGSVIEDTAKGIISAGKLAGSAVDGDAEVKASDIKNIVNATGVATGLPTVAINRIVDAGWRQSEGKDVSPLEYFLGKFGK